MNSHTHKNPEEKGIIMKSGDKIQTLSGATVLVPYAGEHPCFGQRQGWCTNQATWRFEGEHVILHFCDSCKARFTLAGTWTAMDKRPQ
jgi:hypothetical protein